MNSINNSPKIESISWGSIKVEGFEKEFKDVKLYPGCAREWDWNETGTSHSQGIQPGDIQELIDNGSEVVILSRGVLRRLKTSEEAIRFLDKLNIEYEILPTNEAVEVYNDFCSKNKKVGALIHSTC